MPVLTAEILEPSNLYRMGRGMDYNALRRGQELFQQGLASVTVFTGDTATCLVRDGAKSHTVTLASPKANQLTIECSCPASGRGMICAHQAAAMYTTRVYISTVAQNHWRYRLQRGLEQAPAVIREKRPAPYLALFGLLHRQIGVASQWSFHLYTLDLRACAWFAADDPPRTAQDYVHLLDKHQEWRRNVRLYQSPLNPAGCQNLPETEAIFLNTLAQRSNYYYASDVQSFGDYLPWLIHWQLPVYRSEQLGAIKQRLEILEEPVAIEAALGREGDVLKLQTGLRLGEHLYSTLTDKLDIVSRDPLWVLADRYLAQVANPAALTVMQVAPLDIPIAEEEPFRAEFFPRLAERVDIQGEMIAWENIQATATPRLYLSDAEETLYATLCFGYADAEAPCERNPAPFMQENIANTWQFRRIHRQIDREVDYYQMLTDATYGLKRAGSEHPYGTFTLRARTHPYDFLVNCIPALTRAGFEIYGEDKLKLGRINRNTPTLSLGISSGIDWFELEAVVQYGDQSVLLRDVRSALRKGQRYIKLADGSIGELPETWLARYKRLFEMAEEVADGRLRVADYHLPLLDPLLDAAAAVQASADFAERRQRLHDFERIAAQPIPAGFVGELRPYQKAGLDWLHFLHYYGLGGCLADDMGLGKTIQVLALLQSLREQNLRQGPSLLVVPKSLLVNWQREAARFTPDLRILEYTGITRAKDPAAFNDYDLVLTTYGVMLRDAESLRQSRFDYVILDESQNIKNPLAKSAKAARMLNAAHRLVLTGTPVENNTFELWSQFAFLNPGLLGNIEYFKREFATPIERHQDEEAAQMLRRLIYPFILRRTKEQVAPELPALTERVVYVDMEPAQRKVYQRTRDYYRQLLLGMIEEQGLDDARMKILEGLLRLRQASIHPALIEPTYHGEAPKFEMVLETLETLRAEGHKALIFSQFVEVLTLLRKQLDAQKVPYAYLDGQTRQRQAQVDKFQEDPKIPFFLISLKAGGLGLNLTAADYVIHLDPWWNPAVEQQASDRAHRIGQDKPVFVYKIITRDSVEEKILTLQERKQHLVEQLISAEGGFFKALTVEDVKALFA
ncbi:MAG TPA: SNF2-related protein [Anaerolineae bacterium]|nr:SNF2-related protein [Anaerolineae bacterium]